MKKINTDKQVDQFQNWYLYLYFIKSQLLDLKILAISNLDFSTLHLQELFIHNAHLQQIVEQERERYKKEFEKEGKIYRAKYYGEKA